MDTSDQFRPELRPEPVSGTSWDQLGPAGTGWDQLGPTGTGWDQLGPARPAGTNRDRLGPAGTGWDRLGPAEMTHLCGNMRFLTAQW